MALAAYPKTGDSFAGMVASRDLDCLWRRNVAFFHHSLNPFNVDLAIFRCACCANSLSESANKRLFQ